MAATLKDSGWLSDKPSCFARFLRARTVLALVRISQAYFENQLLFNFETAPEDSGALVVRDIDGQPVVYGIHAAKSGNYSMVNKLY